MKYICKASPEERKAMNKALEEDDFIYLDWPAQIYYFELNKMLQKELKQHGRNPEECQVDPDYLF